MAAIPNGVAAYNPGTFVLITATFFMFYLYAAPGVRMGALSNLPMVHFATHDSFAAGQNEPTHQPVKIDSLHRAMPNLTYIRPCDGEEVIGAWMLALGKTTSPLLLSLRRDAVTPMNYTDQYKVAKGPYVLGEVTNAKLILASCGTNLHYAVATAETLTADGILTRVVSCPNFEHFDKQDRAYQESVLPHDGTLIISVEEYIATTWARYVTASIGITGWGYSASNTSNYELLGLNCKGIQKRVLRYLTSLAGQYSRKAEWCSI
ncbi:transketolase [Xylaria telfairii]|nr:transketolase [Xylaria telfairii]